MNYVASVLLILLSTSAFAGPWLAGGLPLSNPDCTIYLTNGHSVGQLQSMLERLGLSEGHRIVLDGARGLPVRREQVTAGNNQPSSIVIERLVGHENLPPYPMMRLEPVYTGNVAFDLVLQTERASQDRQPVLDRDSYKQNTIAHEAYLRELTEDLLNGDVTEFMRDAVPRFRMSLRLKLPDDARDFMAQPDRTLRFSASARSEILNRLGVFEAADRVGQRSEFEGASIRESVTGAEFYPTSATYSFYPRLILPSRANGTSVVANILFYSALHRHLLAHYPEALSLSPDVKVRPEPAALSAPADRPRRLAKGLKRSAPVPPTRGADQIRAEFEAGIGAARKEPVRRFHVDTDLGPFTIEGYEAPTKK